MSRNWLVGGASIVYGAALATTALVTNVAAVVFALSAAGLAWLTVLVHVNASMQLFLPAWVRARGLAVYQLTFMGGQAAAAAVWGLIAQHFGISAALVSAALLLVAGAATIVWWPTYDTAGLDRRPAVYWPAPALLLDPEPEDGPVLVTVRYGVSEENAIEFVRAMEAVGRSRRRTGAIGWDLYRDGANPQKFVEIFTVASWDEHLRQHEGRLTATDRKLEERARALTNGQPEIEHLFPADIRSAAIGEKQRGG